MIKMTFNWLFFIVVSFLIIIIIIEILLHIVIISNINPQTSFQYEIYTVMLCK